MDTLTQLMANQTELNARLADMIEFLEGHLFLIAVAALHVANGQLPELKETAKKAQALLAWRERGARP